MSTCPICGLSSRGGTSPEQMRLDAIAVYVMGLRREHKGNDLIGDICDAIEVRCWGPTLTDRPFTVPGESTG